MTRKKIEKCSCPESLHYREAIAAALEECQREDTGAGESLLVVCEMLARAQALQPIPKREEVL